MISALRTLRIKIGTALLLTALSLPVCSIGAPAASDRAELARIQTPIVKLFQTPHAPTGASEIGINGRPCVALSLQLDDVRRGDVFDVSAECQVGNPCPQAVYTGSELLLCDSPDQVEGERISPANTVEISPKIRRWTFTKGGLIAARQNGATKYVNLVFRSDSKTERGACSIDKGSSKISALRFRAADKPEKPDDSGEFYKSTSALQRNIPLTIYGEHGATGAIAYRILFQQKLDDIKAGDIIKARCEFAVENRNRMEDYYAAVVGSQFVLSSTPNDRDGVDMDADTGLNVPYDICPVVKSQDTIFVAPKDLSTRYLNVVVYAGIESFALPHGGQIEVLPGTGQLNVSRFRPSRRITASCGSAKPELRPAIPANGEPFVTLSQKLSDLQKGDVLDVAVEHVTTNDNDFAISESAAVVLSDAPDSIHGQSVHPRNGLNVPPSMHHWTFCKAGGAQIGADAPEKYLNLIVFGGNSKKPAKPLKIDAGYSRIGIIRFRP